MTAPNLFNVKWAGTQPGADSAQYSLFSTCSTGVADDATHKDNVTMNMNRFGGCGANFFANMALRKFVLSLKNSQAGTLNEYYSPDRGATWQSISSQAVPIPTAGFTTEVEYLIETYSDWRVEWVNGGVAQATWSPQFALSDQRAIP